MNTIEAAKAALLDSDDLSMTERMVLTVIALHANTRTGDAYPSVATIARYAHCSERTVQRALAKLVQLGKLVVSKVAGIATRVYRIVVDAVNAVRGVSSTAQGVTKAGEGVTDPAPGGDTQVSPEVKEDPEEEKKPGSALRTAEGRLNWWQFRKAKPDSPQRQSYPERRGAALPPDPRTDQCPGHRGNPAHNCIPCRGEKLAGGVR